MLLFVLEQIAFLYWNNIGKVWVSYCFLFLFVLEKYWINIGLCCFSCWKRLLFDWNNFGKVLVQNCSIILFVLELYWGKNKKRKEKERKGKKRKEKKRKGKKRKEKKRKEKERKEKKRKEKN